MNRSLFSGSVFAYAATTLVSSFAPNYEALVAGYVQGSGAVYVPSDLTSLYQSRTGGANATSGSVVGIMLDKSYMGGATAADFIAAQPELIVNGTFGTNLTGWTNASTGTGTATWTASGAALARIDAGNAGILRQTWTTVANRWYWVTYSAATAAIKCGVGTSALDDSLSNTSALAGATTVALFRASGTTTHIYFIGTTNATTAVLDNVSVKEIPGFHAIAPSDAARPTVTIAGGLGYLTTNGTENWMQVFPTLNLGEQWWHVGGWRADANNDYAFSLSNSSTKAALLRGSDVWQWRNAADSAFAALSTSNPGTLNVTTVEQTATNSIGLRYNGAAQVAPFDPFDDSGATQGLALFSAINTGAAGVFAGRFYGGAFAPGSLSAGRRAIVEQWAARLAGVTLSP